MELLKYLFLNNPNALVITKASFFLKIRVLFLSQKDKKYGYILDKINSI